jgi:cytochrome c oxidase cbb3-type subunit 1
VVGGFAVYFIGLTIGGLVQGFAMLDVTRPFSDSVQVVLPYLEIRSLGGALMVLGHLIFAAHFIAALMQPDAQAPASNAHDTQSAVPA